eukprot:6871925-Prymnesium_polylepis.1
MAVYQVIKRSCGVCSRCRLVAGTQQRHQRLDCARLENHLPVLLVIVRQVLKGTRRVWSNARLSTAPQDRQEGWYRASVAKAIIVLIIRM